MKFIKKFDTHQNYTGYSDKPKIKIPIPLVSYCDNVNDVHFNNNAEYQKFDILYEKTDGSEQVISTNILEPELGYFPIGICVAKTDALGNYEAARFMGLLYKHFNHLDSYYTENTNNNGAYCFNNVEIADLPMYPTLAEAQQDFNGEFNTKILLEKSRTDSGLNLDTITNLPDVSSTTYSSAAICAYRYKTLTTNFGDWYLPALGECVQIKNNKATINTMLAQLNTKYPDKSAPELYYNSWVYWSSSRANLTTAWRYDMAATPEYNNIGVTNGRRILYMLKLKKEVKRI